MRKIILLIGVLLVVAVVVVLPRLQGQTENVAAQDLQTAAVQRTTLNTSIESSGTVAPEQTVNLAFGTSGTVSEVDVKVGDTVKVGDVIAKLDTSDLEYQVSLQEQALLIQQIATKQLTDPPTDAEMTQAKASLISAQSQLTSTQTSQASATNQATINCSSVDSDQTKLDSAQQTYDQYVNAGYQWDANFVPDPNSSEGQALSTAQSAYDVAKAQCDNITPASDYDLKLQAAQASVDQAQANLDALMAGPSQDDIDSANAKLAQAQLQYDNTKKNLESAVVTAPFDGIISAVNIINGQSAASGTAIATLLDTSKYHVDVAVDEQDIPSVTLGQKANVALAALPDTQIAGTVANIPPSGTSTSSVVTYTVRVDLSGVDQLPIRTGMTTDVQIITASEDNVLVVPTQAIQRTGTNEFVQLYNADRTTTSVPVSTGTTSDGLTVIQGDINEGALVVIPQATTTQTQQGGGFGLPLGGLGRGG